MCVVSCVSVPFVVYWDPLRDWRVIFLLKTLYWCVHANTVHVRVYDLLSNGRLNRRVLTSSPCMSFVCMSSLLIFYVACCNSVKISFFPRDAMLKRGHVGVLCLSVRHVRVFCRDDPQTFFLPWGSHTILVFPYQTLWQYFDGNPRNGGIECRWVSKNRDFRPISRFALSRTAFRGVLFVWHGVSSRPWLRSILLFCIACMCYYTVLLRLGFGHVDWLDEPSVSESEMICSEHGRPQDFLQVGSNCGLDFLKVVCCCTRVLVHFLVNWNWYYISAFKLAFFVLRS